MQQMEALPLKNTFIHFAEPISPKMGPLKTAPGTLLDGSFRTNPPMPEIAVNEKLATTHQPNIPRRTFGPKEANIEEEPAQEKALSPMKIQQKNTFVHLEDNRTPGVPPVFPAPDKTVFLALPPLAQESAGMASAGPVDQVAAQGVAQLGGEVACQRTGKASLGSEGHCTRQCIPCLMQVRWQAGKCASPCKFGTLCGRCHEAHTEDELQKIQARMRKQKKKHGVAAAARLSSAFAKGNVAPVGAGAGAMWRGE